MFSLKSLLFIVAVAALGAAGLIYRTQLWASALVALTLGVLVVAVSRAWFVPAGRTFWGPFALVGGLYLAIVSYQPLQELHYNLPTTQVVVFALEKLQEKIPTASLGSPAPAPSYYTPTTSSYVSPAPPFTPDEPASDNVRETPPSDDAQNSLAPPLEPSTSSQGTITREVEYVTLDPVTNAEKREIRVETIATAGTPPQVATWPYSAPVRPAAYAYDRMTLFQMATMSTYGFTENLAFAAQARAFLWVAQCLWCLLLAFVMGMTCSWLFRRANPAAG